jgi:hypothetical protein
MPNLRVLGTHARRISGTVPFEPQRRGGPGGRGTLMKGIVAAVMVVGFLCITDSLAQASGTAVVDQHDGFSINAPSNWQSFLLTPKLREDMQKGFDSTESKHFRAALTTAGISLPSSQNEKVFAFGPPVAGTNFAPNLNIQVIAANGVPVGRSFVSQSPPLVRQSMQALKVTKYETSTTRVAGQLAVAVTFSIPAREVVQSAGPLTVDETEILVPRNNTIYIIAITTTTSESTQIVLQQVLPTWHWR